jgi:hypothetical protein
MRRTGGLIALAAGVCGALAALLTLIVAGAFPKSGAIPFHAILEWRGVLFSALVVVLALACLAGESRRPALYLLQVSVAATVLSGTLVAFWMAFASLGGLLALLGAKESSLASGAEALTKKRSERTCPLVSLASLPSPTTPKRPGSTPHADNGAASALIPGERIFSR